MHGWMAVCVLLSASSLSVATATENGQPAERPGSPAPKEQPQSKEQPKEAPAKEVPSKESQKERPQKEPPSPKELPQKETVPKEPQKEPPPAPETKHKPEAAKPEKKPPEEEKKVEELPPPPVPKVEETGGKKPVTSLNLTIKLAFMTEPSLFPLEIEVEMDHKKAILTGAVPSEEDKNKAAELAKTIEGVETVVNKLTVNGAALAARAKKQDEAIAQSVKERLNRSETLKAVGFDVKSENGIVSLIGKTHYQVIVLEAAEAARNVPGVRAVNTAGVQLVGKD